MNPYRFDTVENPTMWKGYRRHTRARSTGALVVLVEAEAQGIPADDGGRWALICDDHGSLLQDDRQETLRYYLAHPEEWCDGCRVDPGPCSEHCPKHGKEARDD